METRCEEIIASKRERFKILSNISSPVEKIYYRGNPDLLEGPCVAVVGTRGCTAYGIRVAGQLSERLAESGITVISGLAKGIDTVAHRAAIDAGGSTVGVMAGGLDAGGSTVGVMAGGLDICYPASNRRLKEIMEEKHLLISEHPDGFPAQAYCFPMRNRIISALADAVVVVEAGNRSGALITAEYAAEQGKNVYAVPGNITGGASFGCNKLIREGVTPLVILDDVITDMGLIPKTADTAAESGLGEDEKAVLDIVRKNGEVSIEEIVHKTNIKSHLVSGIITVLEMKGLVFFEMGKVLVAKF